MNDAPEAAEGFSVLTLGFEVLDGRPDWPVLSIRVNGKNPFEQVAKDWRGFDPAEIPRCASRGIKAPSRHQRR